MLQRGVELHHLLGQRDGKVCTLAGRDEAAVAEVTSAGSQPSACRCRADVARAAGDWLR